MRPSHVEGISNKSYKKLSLIRDLSNGESIN